MKRLALFFFFDEQGIVDKYIYDILQDLKNSVRKIVVVVNGKIEEEYLRQLENMSVEVLVRQNRGYDVWAYKEGIDFIGLDVLRSYDEFILMNYTNFGPIYPFKEMFDHMSKRKELDFWGLTKSWGNNRDIPQHIQSHFIVVRKNMLQSNYFAEYWNNVPEIKCYNDALWKHEFVFTTFFEKRGFKWDVYLNIDEFKNSVSNPLLAYPYYMIKSKRTPLIKRKSFFLEPSWVFEIGLKSNLRQAMEYMEKELKYNTNNIWENLLRTQDLQILRWTMGLEFIVSDYGKCEIADDTLVIIDVRYRIDLTFLNEYLEKIPRNVDVYIISNNSNIDFEETKFSRAVHYLFYQGERFSFYEINKLKKYSYIGYANISECRGDLTDKFSLYDKENFDNMFASPEAFSQIINIFKERKEIGVLFSGLKKEDDIINCIWREQYEAINKILIESGINVKTNALTAPIYHLNGFVFFRTEILSQYCEIVSKLLKEGIDRKLSWIFLTLVAQSNNFASGYFYNQKYVTDELNFCEYQKQVYLQGQDYSLDVDIEAMKHFSLKEMYRLNKKYVLEKYVDLKDAFERRLLVNKK